MRGLLQYLEHSVTMCTSHTDVAWYTRLCRYRSWIDNDCLLADNKYQQATAYLSQLQYFIDNQLC